MTKVSLLPTHILGCGARRSPHGLSKRPTSPQTIHAKVSVHRKYPFLHPLWRRGSDYSIHHLSPEGTLPEVTLDRKVYSPFLPLSSIAGKTGKTSYYLTKSTISTLCFVRFSWVAAPRTDPYDHKLLLPQANSTVTSTCAFPHHHQHPPAWISYILPVHFQES